MYKGAIFDLDGTLLDTIEDLANACNYALEKCDLEPHEVDKYRWFVGDGRLKLIERIIPKDQYTEVLFNKVLKLYDEYYLEHMMDCTKPYNGISDMISKLKSDGIKIGILSNKPDEFVQEIVNKYFNNKFDVVYGHRKDYATKPNPESLLTVINELELKESEVIYIGDSNVDMLTGKNANIRTIGVAWGFRGSEELKEAGADYIANTAEELYNIVKKSKK